jgi:hypothetical protein
MISLVPPSFPKCSFVPSQLRVFGHSPAMVSCPPDKIPAPALIEALLTDWFEAPTLLFSSGRAACHVFLTEMGLQRYKHTIVVPAFLSRCILNALTLDAFPVRGTPGDAVLYYHQYGFRLRSVPREPLVLEDACHAFFSRPTSGARAWCGQAAVISLPKFFATYGPVGALVIPNILMAERIRARRDAAGEIDPTLATWQKKVIIDVTTHGRESQLFHLLESAYALLTVYPKVDPEALAGFPINLSELAAVGAARWARLEIFAESLDDTFPYFMLENGLNDLPYALPYFGSGDREILAKIENDLSLLGVQSGIYSVDIARSLYNPKYQPCVLLPCHQEIPIECVKDLCSVIRKTDGGAR